MASYVIEVQPQSVVNNYETFYSVQPVSPSLSAQICNICEKCASVPLNCVCGPVNWCDENCCDDKCSEGWCKGCGSLLCAIGIILAIVRPC